MNKNIIGLLGLVCIILALMTLKKYKGISLFLGFIASCLGTTYSILLDANIIITILFIIPTLYIAYEFFKYIYKILQTLSDQMN